MTKLTEDDIEQLALEQLQTIGYEYRHGSIVAPDGEHSERQSYSDVILKQRLSHAINTLNPHLPQEVREQAFRTVTTINTPDLINNNETFHHYLTEGITVEYQKDGITRGDAVKLIDFDHPENNNFLVVTQFTITENNHKRRPDIILFINGLPLVVIELKNAADEKATLYKAFQQFETYKQETPSLFTYNAFLIITDGLEAKTGSISANFSRFMKWKLPPEQRTLEESNTPELETLITALLNKATLLDFIRHFIVFEKSKHEDPKTKLTKITTVKKIAAYHQYYAVNKAVASIIRASGLTTTETPKIIPFAPKPSPNQPLDYQTGKIKSTQLKKASEPSETYKVVSFPPSQRNKAQKGDRKGGVVWHTQGSGKSLSMVFLTGKLVLSLDNPTIVVLTDRNDLDDQPGQTHLNCFR